MFQSKFEITFSMCISFFLQRKPLAVYLHDDNNIVTNVFCSKMLCSEEIVNYLTENFFVWAWDMTNDKNKAR